jgi:tRNA dimethylallyltransferase|tara:strand:+ start:13346 stop:14275 length:930 start_codon:yes stop_codon:yes gene_type:complete
MQKNIFLLGPTASGKTELAKSLYDDFPLEIISVDSAQIYKGLDIGTAKLSGDDQEKYPHHLIDCKAPCERYSVNEFRMDVEKISTKIYKSDKVPLLVGGTMMYFNALEHPLDEMPESSDEVREKVREELERYGLVYLYEKLSQVDPDIVKKIKPTDTQRILRALEVYYISGNPISSYHQVGTRHEAKYNSLKIALLPKDRVILNSRIEARVSSMIKSGLIEEVELLIKGNPELDLTYPALRCVGYKQVYECLTGVSPIKELNEKIIIATRQLAKRQMTWIRGMENLLLIDPFNAMELKSVIGRVKKFLN